VRRRPVVAHAFIIPSLVNGLFARLPFITRRSARLLRCLSLYIASSDIGFPLIFRQPRLRFPPSTLLIAFQSPYRNFQRSAFISCTDALQPRLISGLLRALHVNTSSLSGVSVR